jgi:hypothetical protein
MFGFKKKKKGIIERWKKAKKKLIKREFNIKQE